MTGPPNTYKWLHFCRGRKRFFRFVFQDPFKFRVLRVGANYPSDIAFNRFSDIIDGYNNGF